MNPRMLIIVIAALSLATGTALAFCAFSTRDNAVVELGIVSERTQQPRSELTSSVRVVEDAGLSFLEVRTEGSGRFADFDRASIKAEARLICEDGFYKPLYSRMTIRGLDGIHFLTREARFDYARKKVVVILRDEEHTRPRTFTYRIKGPTADYASLFLFLTPYVPLLQHNNSTHLYLLSFDARMYGVNFKKVKNETIELPDGPRSSVKTRLIADFVKVADEVFDKLVPPTFLWFDEKAPHSWLRYQGMETGYKSEYVISELRDLLPAPPSPEKTVSP